MRRPRHGQLRDDVRRARRHLQHVTRTLASRSAATGPPHRQEGADRQPVALERPADRRAPRRAAGRHGPRRAEAGRRRAVGRHGAAGADDPALVRRQVVPVPHRRRPRAGRTRRTPTRPCRRQPSLVITHLIRPRADRERWTVTSVPAHRSAFFLADAVGRDDAQLPDPPAASPGTPREAIVRRLAGQDQGGRPRADGGDPGSCSARRTEPAVAVLGSTWESCPRPLRRLLHLLPLHRHRT